MLSTSKNITLILPYLWANQDKRNKLLIVTTLFYMAFETNRLTPKGIASEINTSLNTDSRRPSFK